LSHFSLANAMSKLLQSNSWKDCSRQNTYSLLLWINDFSSMSFWSASFLSLSCLVRSFPIAKMVCLGEFSIYKGENTQVKNFLTPSISLHFETVDFFFFSTHASMVGRKIVR